jgi:hypothetical protein
MSAAGTYVTPMIIFSRKNFSNILDKEAPLGSLFTWQTSGRINSSVSGERKDHFVYSVKPTRSAPVLFVLDGYISPTKSINLIDKARANHINIFVFPPHTKHKLQPLDKTFTGDSEALLQ